VSPAPPSDPPPTDPFALWRQLYAAHEHAWNAALERSLASPTFAEAQGKLLATLLHLQKALREQVRASLEAVNVPSREDIARLGELIVGLEEKVDQLTDRVLDLEAALQPPPPAAPRLPPTRALPPAADGAARRRAPRPSGRAGRAGQEP
jgi:polyhydroxyalkanoic acid synthase PhaR subunit